jgi:hypothetical protein
MLRWSYHLRLLLWMAANVDRHTRYSGSASLCLMSNDAAGFREAPEPACHTIGEGAWHPHDPLPLAQQVSQRVRIIFRRSLLANNHQVISMVVQR